VVQYDGIEVGSYAADLLVENAMMISVHATDLLDAGHAAQVTNILRATGLPLGLLFNFGTPRLEIRRLVNGPRHSRPPRLLAAAGA